jgi:hypothetical protein
MVETELVCWMWMIVLYEQRYETPAVCNEKQRYLSPRQVQEWTEADP